ncbi:hypothetical protein [Campylobacter sp. RM16190]|uniref:hypothetical protein n=2 Tax=Campylobacter TaxID=194 RepID=UPI001474D880|nr:hypothetical protein [Campylobacter sp. RM16190]
MFNFIFSWKCYFLLLIIGVGGYLAVPYLDAAGAHNETIEVFKILTMAMVMGIAIYLLLAIWVILFKTIRSSSN